VRAIVASALLLWFEKQQKKQQKKITPNLAMRISSRKVSKGWAISPKGVKRSNRRQLLRRRNCVIDK